MNQRAKLQGAALYGEWDFASFNNPATRRGPRANGIARRTNSVSIFKEMIHG